MSWAALFERAEAFDVEAAAVLDALAERRGSGREPPDDPETDP